MSATILTGFGCITAGLTAMPVQKGGSKKVVRLVNPDDAYRKDAIKTLGRLLRAAKQGEILSIAYICERPGNGVTFGTSRIKDTYALMGYLMMQMYLACQDLEERSVPSDIDEED